MQQANVHCHILQWIQPTSLLLPAKGKEVSEGAAILYLECEPKLPSCLNCLDKSLCLGVGFSMYLSRGASFLPALPVCIQKAEAVIYYGFIKAKGDGGLRLVAISATSTVETPSQSAYSQLEALRSLWSSYRVKINASWSAFLIPRGWAWLRNLV